MKAARFGGTKMLTNLSFSLGQHWVDHYLAGMMLLHTLLGHNPAVTPRSKPTPEILQQVLQEVVAGTYAPDKYFKPGPAPQLSLISQPPSLAPNTHYLIIG